MFPSTILKIVDAVPTLVKVTAVPGRTAVAIVEAVPIVMLLVVVAIPTTETLVITDPTDIESPIATPLILLRVKEVVPIPTVCPTETDVSKIDVVTLSPVNKTSK